MTISFTVNEKPMSMNMVYPTNKQGRRYLKPEGKDYKDFIAIEAICAMRGQAILKDDVRVEINYYFPNKRMDTNNCHKLILDAMQGVVYENDRQIYEEHYYRHIDKINPRMEITVTTL